MYKMAFHLTCLVVLALALAAASCSTDPTPPEPVGTAASASGFCNVDSDCSSSEWCNENTSTCTTKYVNGAVMPSDPGRTGTPLDGTCNTQAAQLVCRSGVCYGDGVGGKGICGYPDRVGPCSAGNAAIVCRSGACSIDLTCEPLGGCHLDQDCAGGLWCDESSDTCTPKIVNGSRIPSDPPHVELTLNKTCTTPAAQLVCASGVCDTNGPMGTGVCGYADGNGTCTTATGPTLCQSGACSVTLTCRHASGCNVDADCPAAKWCSPATFSCVPKVANGSPVPTVSSHQPALTGMCTASAALAVCASSVCDTVDNDCGYANGDGPCAVTNGATVCRSSVCDPADSACGYANGDGPCNATNAGIVCRSATCSSNGTCEPAGGCNVDADCPVNAYCNAFLCVPKVANGKPVPTAPSHQPPLTGTCTALAAGAACASGICDTADNACGYANGDGPCSVTNGGVVCRSTVCDPADGKCGYANGDGPCDMADGSTVCRSAMCSTNGECEPAGGCNVDADCPLSKYCAASLCVSKVANGDPMPTVPGHLPPLTGTCSPMAGLAACASGVCDTADNKCGFANGDGPCTVATGAVCRSSVCDANDGKCGYANGDGPCTGADGTTVCRSTSCATMGPNQGTCVACATDAACAGATPACNPTSNTCVQCTGSNATACTGATSVCDVASSTCAPCDGDLGSGAKDACTDASTPFCFLTGSSKGQCGKCTMDADCLGHPSGNTCDTTMGTCYQACHSDADCTSTQWCNAPTDGAGACVTKLANGTPLPKTPVNVAMCSTAVGQRVCQSTVCDSRDNACGFAGGDGPCTDNAECRNMMCDLEAKTCSGCNTDADCPAGDYCASDGACVPKLPTGSACGRARECISDLCFDGVCNSIVGSGHGLICSARGAGQGGGDTAGAFGLVLAAAGLARRSRVRRAGQRRE